jgi:hypothetical protein
MIMLRRATVLLVCGLSAACQSTPSQDVPSTPSGKSAALLNMERVAIAAHRCWFASSDPAFREYSFANELNSFSGQPRFLLVPRGDYGGRPLLVVQASGAAGTVSAFGPLLDVARWSGGDTTCGASA